MRESKQLTMETFPFIANNFIRQIRKWLAVAMSAILISILCIGCSNSAKEEVSSKEIQETPADTKQDTTDTTEDNETKDVPLSTEVTIGDLNGEHSTPEEQEALLRDHNRTEMNTKLLQCRAREGEEWIVHLFDILCKMFVSESKVRQGIFHFRLQSDDEEAPQRRFVA